MWFMGVFEGWDGGEGRVVFVGLSGDMGGGGVER
jgi:hypothetical protein